MGLGFRVTSCDSIFELPGWYPMYFVVWRAMMFCDLVYACGLEASFQTCVYLFLCGYLRAPLADDICGLIDQMSMVLYFQYVVWCAYCFTLCHVCVCGMGRFLPFVGLFPYTRVCGDCFVVGYFVVGRFSWSMYLSYDSCMTRVCCCVLMYFTVFVDC